MAAACEWTDDTSLLKAVETMVAYRMQFWKIRFGDELMSESEWTKSSWRSFEARQQPAWPDDKAYFETLNTLSELPPLVFAGESRTLKEQLAEAAAGKAFVLQCGDCAEDFSRCNGAAIREILKVILQMSVVLAYAGQTLN
jgi:3-deoxy-7-phosphoheptulonate synthase